MKPIFILSVVFLFILFVFFYWRRISVLFTRLLKGKYHHKYLSKHRKYFKTNPYAYCIKEDYFTRLMPFMEEGKNIPHIKAGQNMLPQTYPFFSSFKSVKRREGKAKCYQSYFEFGTDIKIIGYSTKLAGTPARRIHYFIDELLFMTEFVIRETGTELNRRLLKLVFDADEAVLQHLSGSSFYVDVEGEAQIFLRDAAFSTVISHLQENHPQTKKGLEKLKKGLLERRQSLVTGQKKS